MDATLEFIGTATTLLRLGPYTLLTDPDFRHQGHRAYLGNGLFSQRRTEPSRQPDTLPPLDAVLLSHLHGDHFDPIAREQLDHRLVQMAQLGDAAGHQTQRRKRHADDLTTSRSRYEAHLDFSG